jgi:ubiquinol-cytochrome c reductase cytochrome c subunit
MVLGLAAALFVILATRSAVAAHAQVPAPATQATPAAPAAPADAVAYGRQLYLVRCTSCHGLNAEGVAGVGPPLIDAGAAAADFYLSTGRMPLSDPNQQPVRHRPAYPPDQIAAMVAYIGSLDSGPPIPTLPVVSDLAQGFQLYSLNCAQCHSAAGAGGALGYGDVVPSLAHATRLQAAEAMRVGPSPMPVFGPDTLTDRQVGDIAGYVEYLHHPYSPGGLGLGHLGPIPEGFVAWVVGMGLLLLTARLIGTRA